MQAVILAGGLGTRLAPLTDEVPKSLLEVAERPFIDWQLRRLRHCGFDRVHLCIGHLGHLIQKRVGDGHRYDLRVTYSDDGPELRGTAGALRRGLCALDPEFVVTYGDSYLPFDYAAPLRELEAYPEAMGTMSVFKNDGRWDASNTQIASGRVIRYEKGGREAMFDHIDYGAIALRRSVIAELDPSEKRGLDELQEELARVGKLRAYVAPVRFYEIGSPAGLAELDRALRQGEVAG